MVLYLGWIVLLIFITVFVLIIVFRSDLYRPDPSRFGTFLERQLSVCQAANARCGEKGQLTVTQVCEPNLNTGLGCLNPETGEQTYRPIVTQEECTVECVQSEFVDTDLSDCLSFQNEDVTAVENWIYFPATDPSLPLIPIARNPTQCFETFPNTYKRVQRVCTAVEPNGLLNKCQFFNPRTLQDEIGDIGFTYQTLIPCSNYPNRNCGTWVTCPSYDRIEISLDCVSSVPGRLFEEVILILPRICRTDAAHPCRSTSVINTNSIPDGNVGLPGSNKPCIVYPSTALASPNCDRVQFLMGNPEICHEFNQNQIYMFLVGSTRRAFSPIILINPSLSIQNTIVTLSEIGCPGAFTTSLGNEREWQVNPYCIRFCRITLDLTNYGDIRDMVKNRDGFLLQSSGIQPMVTAYLDAGPFNQLPNIDTVTPMDFRRVRFTSINSSPNCTNSDIIQTNSIVLSLIPTSQNGIYKVTGTVKADIFGWLVSGQTLRTFFPTSNQIYFQSEIDLINMELLNIPANQQAGLIATRNHVQTLLNNWTQIIDSIQDSDIYWVPARVDLLRPTHAIGPVQSQADRFRIGLRPSSSQINAAIPPELPEIVTLGSNIPSRTFEVTSFENTVTSESLLQQNQMYLLALSIDFARYDELFPVNGTQLSIRDLFATRDAQEDGVLPPCRI